MKVLVIEDDPTDRKLAGAILKISGHSVLEKTSAEGAIRQLKANAGTSRIPVVVVTAHPERKAARRCGGKKPQ